MRSLVLSIPMLLAVACGQSDCECEACSTAIEACETDDADCEAAAIALCDAGDDTAAE